MTFTEGKGYKVFLDDANGTFAYSRYNPDTKSYSLTFDYDMGNFGQPRVVLTYLDEDFAAQYDGVGLGRKPPIFSSPATPPTSTTATAPCSAPRTAPSRPA